MKKLVSYILVVAMMCSLLVGGCGNIKSTNGDFITRADWAEAVGVTFGMSQYNSETPYFEDVDSNSDIFKYVQSAYEWGVISTDGNEYNPEDVATLGFAASSAVMILNAGETFGSSDEIIQKAVEYGIIGKDETDKNKLKNGIDKERADAILVATEALYLGENATVVNEVKLADGVVDYSQTSGSQTSDTQSPDTQPSGDTSAKQGISYVGDGVYSATEDAASSLSDGQVITVEGAGGKDDVVAVKVAGVADNGDGTYTVNTVQPEMEEVFDSVTIKGTRYADYETVIPAEGVTIVPLSDTGSADGTSFRGIPDSNASQLRVTKDENGNFVQTSDSSSDAKSNFEMSVSLKQDLKTGKVKVSFDAAAEEDYENDIFSYGSKVKIDETGKITTEYKNELYTVKVDTPDGEKLKKFVDSSKIAIDDIVSFEPTEIIDQYTSGQISQDNLEKSLSDLFSDQEKKELEAGDTTKESFTVTGGIKVQKLAVTPDIEFGKIFGATNIFDFKKATVRITGNVTPSLTVKGEFSEEIKLADVPIPTGVPGLTINLQMYLTGDLNGKLSVKSEVSIDNKIECQKGCKPRQCNSTTMTNETSFSIEAKLGLAPDVAIYLLGFDVFSLRLKVSIGADFTAEKTCNGRITIDGDTLQLEAKYNVNAKVAVYAPLISLDVNKTPGNVLGKIGLSLSAEFITKDDLKNNHIGMYEDATLYDDSVTVTYDIPLNDEDETEEPTAGDVNTAGYIDLDNIVVQVDEGSTVNVCIESLPVGYSTGDIQWSVEDSSIASITAGVVTDSNGENRQGVIVSGHKDGNTVIHARTSDGKYDSTCTVLVIGTAE